VGCFLPDFVTNFNDTYYSNSSKIGRNSKIKYCTRQHFSAFQLPGLCFSIEIGNWVIVDSSPKLQISIGKKIWNRHICSGWMHPIKRTPLPPDLRYRAILSQRNRVAWHPRFPGHVCSPTSGQLLWSILAVHVNICSALNLYPMSENTQPPSLICGACVMHSPLVGEGLLVSYGQVFLCA
jgi:hypothetical protein